MPNFRKRPVEVEAMLYDGTMEAQRAIVNWANGMVSGWFDGDYYLSVQTLHGEVEARTGDWVIKGPSGDFWPCKPDIFAETYEEVAPHANTTVSGTWQNTT